MKINALNMFLLRIDILLKTVSYRICLSNIIVCVYVWLLCFETNKTEINVHCDDDDDVHHQISSVVIMIVEMFQPERPHILDTF